MKPIYSQDHKLLLQRGQSIDTRSKKIWQKHMDWKNQQIQRARGLMVATQPHLYLFSSDPCQITEKKTYERRRLIEFRNNVRDVLSSSL